MGLFDFEREARIERLCVAILRKLDTNEHELEALLKDEETEMVDLVGIKAKEDAALVALKSNDDKISAIKDKLDAKDATIADLSSKLKDALASGADPVV